MEEFKYFNNMQDIHSDIYDKISEKLSAVIFCSVTTECSSTSGSMSSFITIPAIEVDLILIVNVIRLVIFI